MSFIHNGINYSLKLTKTGPRQIELTKVNSNGLKVEVNANAVFCKSYKEFTPEEKSMSNVFIETLSVHNMLRKRGVHFLPAIISYLDQAVEGGQINLAKASNIFTQLVNENKWNEEFFSKEIMNKVAPLVKNCNEAENKFIENFKKCCLKSVSDYYNQDEEDIKNELIKKVTTNLIDEIGRSEYNQNRRVIDEAIREQAEKMISENKKLSDIRELNQLSRGERDSFIRDKADEIFNESLIKINIKNESGQTIQLNVPSQTPASILKAMIFNRTGIAPCMQQLMFNSKPFSDLTSQGVGNNHTLFMFKRVGGG